MPCRTVSLAAALLIASATGALVSAVDEIAAAPSRPAEPPVPRRLHIGGKEVRRGWEILNTIPGPGVDHLGNVQNMSAFPNGTFVEVYASHVMEHLSYQVELYRALSEIRRVLVPGGLLRLSVPDMKVLGRAIGQEGLDAETEFELLRLIYGGQMDWADFHKMGFTAQVLMDYLRTAGFLAARRVESFGLFNDTSEWVVQGERMSLNMEATA